MEREGGTGIMLDGDVRCVLPLPEGTQPGLAHKMRGLFCLG